MTKRVFALFCFVAITTVRAQSPGAAGAMTVSVPVQFAKAKTLFVGYAGLGWGGSPDGKVATAFLQDMQAALLQSKRYTPVSSPSDADLSMRFSIESSQGEVTGGSSTNSPYVRLAFFDTKTGMLLWTIDEQIGASNRSSTFFKNLNSAVVKAVQDMDALATGKLPFGPA